MWFVIGDVVTYLHHWVLFQVKHTPSTVQCFHFILPVVWLETNEMKKMNIDTRSTLDTVKSWWSREQGDRNWYRSTNMDNCGEMVWPGSAIRYLRDAFAYFYLPHFQISSTISFPGMVYSYGAYSFHFQNWSFFFKYRTPPFLVLNDNYVIYNICIRIVMSLSTMYGYLSAMGTLGSQFRLLCLAGEFSGGKIYRWIVYNEWMMVIV